MSPLHFIVAIIALFFLAQTIVQFVRGETLQSFIKFVVKFFIWGGIFFFALFPHMARIVSQTLHIGDNLNTLIFIGFIVVFAFIFRLLRVIEQLERNVTLLTRENALRNIKTKTRRG